MAFVTWVGGRNVVIQNGQAGEEFDAVSWPLALSDDGRIVAYQSRRDGFQFCVVGKERSRPYRSVGLPVISADGSVVTFAASNDDGWRVVRNGQEGPHFDWVGNLVLHSSGRQLAYTAECREAGVLKSFVVFNDTPGDFFDRVTQPVLSRDGNVVAYGGLKAGRWHLVVGRQEVPVDGEITRVFLSPDGSRSAYVLDAGPCRRLIGPSGAGPVFDWIGEAAFERDGRITYLAARSNRKFLVVDHHEIGLGRYEVSDLVLTADGRQAGFSARADRSLYWKAIGLPPPGEPVAKEDNP